MAEIIEDAFDRPVMDGDFARDLWAGKSTRRKLGPLTAFISFFTSKNLNDDLSTYFSQYFLHNQLHIGT